MSRRTPVGRSALRLATSRRKKAADMKNLSPEAGRGSPFGVVASMSAVERTSPTPLAQNERILSRQQHRGDLRSRHSGAQGGVARRAEGRDRRAARRQRCGQDHDAEGDLQPAACRARRRDQGLDRIRRSRGPGPVAQRARAARLHPGDGRPSLFRPSHDRGESADRRVHPARRQGRDQARPRPGLRLFPASFANARIRLPATPRAANSRCAPSAAH